MTETQVLAKAFVDVALVTGFKNPAVDAVIALLPPEHQESVARAYASLPSAVTVNMPEAVATAEASGYVVEAPVVDAPAVVAP